MIPTHLRFSQHISAIRPRRKAASRARHRTNFDTTSDELSLEEEVIQPTQVFLQTQVEEEKEVVEDLHEQSKEEIHLRNCFLPHYSTSLSMSPLARSLETELSQATPPKEKEVVDLEEEIDISVSSVNSSFHTTLHF